MTYIVLCAAVTLIAFVTGFLVAFWGVLRYIERR